MSVEVLVLDGSTRPARSEELLCHHVMDGSVGSFAVAEADVAFSVW